MTAARVCKRSSIAAVGTRRGLTLGRSTLRADCTASQGQRPRPSPGTNSPQDCLCPGSVRQAGVARQNSLRALWALRSNNRREFDHEARCARRPRPCASRSPRDRPHRMPTTASSTSGGVRACFETKPAPRNDVCKVASGAAAARLGGAEKHRSQGRARSALRCLTRRGCQSAAPAGRVVSFAPGPETEHRRAVGARRRPLPWRAAAGADAALPRDTHSTQSSP